MTYNFKGSEKQIKWAEDIAAEAFGELDSLDHNIDNIPGYQLNHEAVEEVRKSLGRCICAASDAGCTQCD